MKLNTLNIIRVAAVFVLGFIFIPSVVNAQNGITGTVFNQVRRPATDVDVELLDEFERFIRSEKTRSSGMYIFNNLRAGVYYIHIRNNGVGYVQQKIRIQLGATNRANGNATTGIEVRQQNIYLQVDPRNSNKINLNNEVVFAQEVPNEAQSAYRKGINYAKSKKHELAITEFLHATKIFPEYYLALIQLANGYLKTKNFEQAANVFDRAIKVNSKSFTGLFGLAVAQNGLNKKADAEINIKKAIELSPNTVAYHLMLGILQREQKKYTDAEQSLIKAKTLSNNKEPDVHYNLGLLYFWNLKRYTAAADELELYLKASPKMPKENKVKTQNMIRAIRKKAKQQK